MVSAASLIDCPVWAASVSMFTEADAHRCWGARECHGNRHLQGSTAMNSEIEPNVG
jgi:hypothetical protein